MLSRKFSKLWLSSYSQFCSSVKPVSSEGVSMPALYCQSIVQKAKLHVKFIAFSALTPSFTITDPAPLWEAEDRRCLSDDRFIAIVIDNPCIAAKAKFLTGLCLRQIGLSDLSVRKQLLATNPGQKQPKGSSSEFLLF